MRPHNIASVLIDAAARGRDTAYVHRPALVADRWSYGRVVTLAYRFARELAERQIGKGERVILIGPNSPQWVAAFFGCLINGAVVVPLDHEGSHDFAVRVVRSVRPRLVVASAEHQRLGDVPALQLELLETALAARPGDAIAPLPVEPSDAAEIVFTSGTTAEPKGVVITHGNLTANLDPLAREIAKYARVERIFHPIRFLDLLPLSHVFGQFMGLFVPQLLNGEVHFHGSLGPAGIVDTIRRDRISVAVVVPRILQSLRATIEHDYEDRGWRAWLDKRIETSERMSPFVRWWVFRHAHRRFGAKFWAFVIGGAALDPRTELFWRRLGFAVVQGYGMTETASLVSVNHPFKTSRGSIGKVLPGQEVKLGPGGEILVRGANVTPGYWDPETGIRPSTDEWLATGDVGELDAEGNLFFRGRKKSVIVTAAGLNIYPEDIEAALDRQPEIVASCVVEMDDTTGPEPAAAIILREAGSGGESAVARANASLAEYQRVRRWIEWPDRDFPRTPTQKVRIPEVAEVVRARLADRAAVTAPQALTRLVAHVAGTGTREVPAGATLETLGLDSLGRVELLSAIEDRYQVDVDEAAFSSATTVDELERILRGAATVEPVQHRFPDWAGRWPVWAIRMLVLYGVILPLASIMCRVRVEGRERLASVGRQALFVSNHVTSSDAALILSALPGRFRRHFAIAMLGEMLLGWIHPPDGTGLVKRLRYRAQYVLVVALFNVFPLPQATGFRRSFAFAGTLVERGNSVLVFPEGLRTPTGDIQTFRSGVGILATGLGLPVVPVRIRGLYELRENRTYFSRPGTVTISFGDPQTYAAGNDPADIADDLESRVRGL